MIYINFLQFVIDLPKLINIVNIFEINYQPIDFNENFFYIKLIITIMNYF